MKVVDSRQLDGGILTLQDHSQGAGIHHRHFTAAMRQVDRDEDGRIVPGTRTAGDLVGAFAWRPFTREIPAWSFVFPSQTVSGGTRTSARPGGSAGAVGAGGLAGSPSGPAPDGPGASPGPGGGNFKVGVIPGGAVGIGGFSINPQSVGNTDKNFGLFGIGSELGGYHLDVVVDSSGNPVGFSDGGTIGGSPGGLGSPGAVGPKGLSGVGTSNRGDAGLPTFVLPTTDAAWVKDERFAKLSPDTPLGWPSFPEKWHGVTVQSTEEQLQREYFHPTDPRIPLVHRGEYPACGALACDLSGSEPDLDRHARLHSMLRIIKTPPGSARNSVGWNLTTSGGGDTAGGWVIDHGQKSEAPKKRGPTTPDSGPFRGPNGGVSPGARLGQANQFGIFSGRQNSGGAAGTMIAHASWQMGGPFHPGTSGDRHGIGADGDGHRANALHLQTGTPWINPGSTSEDGPFLFESLWLPGDDYEYVVDVHLAFDAGSKYHRWWSTSAEQDGNTPPGVPTPPTTPPTTPPDVPPVDPPPPPTTPGDRYDPPIPPPPPTDIPGWRVPRRPGSLAPGAPQGGASAPALRVDHTRRWLEMSTAAQSFRAPLWSDGAPHLTHSRGQARREEFDRIAPTVLRMETFAKQVTNGYGAYTQSPGSSRYEGGTMDGGLWFFPPEVGGEDHAAAFDPGDRQTSTSYLGMGIGTSLAFGTPDFGTGGVNTGYAVRGDGGDLVFDRYDASATKAENFRMTTAGTMRFRDIGSDPATPPAGYVDVYAKSGDMFQIDDTGTVTQLS